MPRNSAMGFKFHRLMRYGMIETQHIGMQAQALAWIITITMPLDVTTHRMPYIGLYEHESDSYGPF